MKVRFTKMHGSGNDFIIVNEFDNILIPIERKKDFVSKISDRHFGVGSDGVIFVQKSGRCDAKFSFYNPDGTEAEMCGNGIRCFARYVYEKGIVRKKIIDVETLAGVIRPELVIEKEKVKEVRVDMGCPGLKRGEIPLTGDPDANFIDQEVKINGHIYRITAVGMGNPHAVLFCDDIEKIDVRGIGSRIRYYTELFPNGTNVHFVQKVEDNEFKIRTYERGVEDETLACGTGICASAVATVLNKLANIKEVVKFHARGGDLKVKFDADNGKISRVYLIGDAVFVFEGEIGSEYLYEL